MSVRQLLSSYNYASVTPPSLVYVQFTVNIHDDLDTADLIHVGNGAGNFLAVYRVRFGLNYFEFYDQIGGDFSDSGNGTFLLDTTYTVDMKIEFTGPDATITPRIDGVELAMFSSPGLELTTIQFGALGSGSVNNHNLDSLAVGTTGYGTSDIFSADFASTIVPPFDSTTGSGLSISGGTLLVSNAGTDAYATKVIF